VEKQPLTAGRQPRHSKPSRAKVGGPTRRREHQGKRVLLTGATGFVGQAVLAQLLKDGWEVVTVARHLLQNGPIPGVLQVAADITGVGWQRWCEGCTAMIHLVGIIGEQPRKGVTFDRLHRVATERVVTACKTFGVRRLVHMSALGARADASTPYLRTKWQGEEVVRGSGLEWTIMRPSVIFGPGDGFTSALAGAVKTAPIFPVFGDGHYKVQPIAVAEVAECFVKALELPEAEGQVYELGGPEALPYNEVLLRVAAALELGRFLWHVPLGLVSLVVSMIERLPFAPLTRDQLTMLLEGSTCDVGPTLAAFGVPREHFEGPIWLGQHLTPAGGIPVVRPRDGVLGPRAGGMAPGTGQS
jgi:uncharacterized protein YbjT (DUF2867 family)